MSSSQSDHFDVLVLGSGEAGKYIAWTLSSKAGKRCGVVERLWCGGSCPNVACLPSKNLVHSANVAHLASQRATYGLLPLTLDREGSGMVNMYAVRERKRDMVKGLIELHSFLFDKNGVELIWGEGKFVGPKAIEIAGKDGSKRILTGDKIVICTGSRARIDDIPGLKEAKPLTHIEILELDEVPRHLVILGGGYVGLEFAQAMKRLGAEVTVIEKNATLLKNEDEDVRNALRAILEDEGVKVWTSTAIAGVSGESGRSVTLKGTASGKHLEIVGSHILCATGRIPNTENIGLENANVMLTGKGFVGTNEKLETSNTGVFAVGDCAGSPHFTHVAFDDFRIVRDVLLGKPTDSKRVTGRQVPFTLYTSPELAHVGLREHQASSLGLKYRLTKIPMEMFLKTRTLGETFGFAKALIAEDDTILGFTVLGSGAGELLPLVQLVMKKGLPYTDIAELIITHPTLNEGLVSLFSNVPAREQES